MNIAYFPHCNENCYINERVKRNYTYKRIMCKDKDIIMLWQYLNPSIMSNEYVYNWDDVIMIVIMII